MDIPRRATATTLLPPDPAKSSADEDLLAREAPALPAKRIINMNYVLVQIYDKEPLAKDAADALAKNGVDTTIVQGLPRWAANTKWYCVLGTKGFGPKATNTPNSRLTWARFTRSTPPSPARVSGRRSTRSSISGEPTTKSSNG